MGDSPWDQNEGKFDKPSSAPPAATDKPASSEQRREAVHQAERERFALRGIESVFVKQTAEPQKRIGDAAAITPEARAGMWQKLSDLAGHIRDEETRVQYLATWRARYEREFPTSSPVPEPVTRRLEPVDLMSESGVPTSENVAEARLIQIVTRGEALMADRRSIADEIKYLMEVAKVAGFDPKIIRACIKMRESDDSARHDFEAMLVVYRRVLGIKGPLDEAMLPQIIEGRSERVVTGQKRRVNSAMAMITGADMAES